MYIDIDECRQTRRYVVAPLQRQESKCSSFVFGIHTVKKINRLVPKENIYDDDTTENISKKKRRRKKTRNETVVKRHAMILWMNP